MSGHVTRFDRREKGLWPFNHEQKNLKKICTAQMTHFWQKVKELCACANI